MRRRSSAVAIRTSRTVAAVGAFTQLNPTLEPVPFVSDMNTPDPRYYQIAVLSLLVIYGIAALDFGIRWQNALAIFCAAEAAQFIGTRAAGLSRFDPLSPIITSLSLTLLLRTDTVLLALLAAFVAIGSKFLVRVQGKHVFNPANVALVSLMLLFDNAWVSSGQWGSAVIGTLLLGCLGCLVLTRAKRAETTIMFLCVYTALIFGRAQWLGDPLSIPLHQLQNGALLIFAFFMISDPKTTPDTRLGRLAFGAIVASVAYTIQYVYYTPNGVILALVMSAPLVPLIDTIFRGENYRWDQPGNRAINPGTSFSTHGKGVF